MSESDKGNSSIKNERQECDSNKPAKKLKIDDVVSCAICMEEGTDVSPILPSHQCPQCVKEAWSICLVCNESLLSRRCPICKGDYAPVVMHLVPGPPLKKLADTNLDTEEKTKLLYKFGVIRQVIGRSNVAIWSNFSKKMHFSLPQEIACTSEHQRDVTYSIVSVPLNETDVSGEEFLFNNNVWDMIENEVEHGAIHAGQEVDMQRAMNFILDVTKEDGHKLFTMMTPQDWQYMMDPSESADTTEALRVIRNSILEPIMNLIPSSPVEKKHG